MQLPWPERQPCDRALSRISKEYSKWNKTTYAFCKNKLLFLVR